MIDFIRSAALIWIGACVRNKEDRDATLKFFNEIGSQVEKIVKDILPEGDAVNDTTGTAPEQPDEYV